jgi:heptosyltransferase II
MKQFLIIQTASIGDVILATPLIETLHLNFPNAGIDVLVKKGNESLFSGHPFVREVLVWDKSQKKYHNLFLLLGKIRKTRYNVLINCQRFASSGLLTLLSGSGQTIGFSKNPFSLLFSKKYPHHIGTNPYRHEVERNLQLLSSFCSESSSQPRLYPLVSDFQHIEEYIKGSFITLSPASLWFTKQFPAEKWIEFIRQLPENMKIILLGGENDSQLCERIITESKHSNLINLAGKLSMLQSVALMSKALMNYVNDSAPQHFASAVNAPVTAIFCSTVKEFGFGPLSDDAVIVEVEEELDCRPCGLHGHRSCPKKHFKCAENIKITQLLQTLPK